jgi:hypothetical protein
LESPSEEVDKLFASLEGVLADGQDIEMLRFEELRKLWMIQDKDLPDKTTLNRIASDIDHFMDKALISAGKLTVAELHHAQQLALCNQVASHMAAIMKLGIPNSIISGSFRSAVAIFDIRERYIYRDWQSAIGDLMLKEIDNASRRFDVIGFGEFEERFTSASKNAAGTDKTWFSRLEDLIRDVDINKSGIFDARREQIIGLYAATKSIYDALTEKLREHRRHQSQE